MVPVGKRYGTESGGWFQIARRTPEQLVFERLVKPRKGKADPHVHLDFVQTWSASRAAARWRSGVSGAS
jgi:hypothetical protein